MFLLNFPFRCAIIFYKNGIYDLRHELPRDLRNSALFHMKTRVSFKYFVNDCSLLVLFSLLKVIRGFSKC